MVSFETNFAEAAQRKQAKYVHLVEQAQAKGYTAQLVTLQVGSWGVPDLPGCKQLARHEASFGGSVQYSSVEIFSNCSRNRLID